MGIGSRNGRGRFNPRNAFYSAETGEEDTRFNWGLEKGVGCMGVKSDWLERPRAYMARKGRKVVAEKGRLDIAGSNE